MADLTELQREALIEAVTEHWGGWGDAWDNILSDNDRKDAAAYFLAGVCWAATQSTSALADIRLAEKR